MTASATTAQPLPLHREEAGPNAGVVTMTLEQPGSPVVVLDLPLIQRIEATLKLLLAKPPLGMVLASASPRVFVAGADLKSIQAPGKGSSGLDDHALEQYLAYGQRVFGMIAELPCPTAAAINGAALGGGLELAMHCDALIAAPAPMRDGQPGKPYPIGLPEAGLSICPGWGGTNLLPARMDPEEAIRRTCAGRPMLFDEAVKAGMFDRVADSAEKLLDTAKSWVVANRNSGYGRRDGAPSRWIGRSNLKSMVSAAAMKLRDELGADPQAPAGVCIRCVLAGLDEGWQAALTMERRELTRLRGTPAGRESIRGFFEKSKK